MTNLNVDSAGSVATQPSRLIAALTDSLAQSASGVAFISSCLDEVTERWGLRGAVAVIAEETGQRQVFNAGRRPLHTDWERQVALRQGPGLHTDPALVDRAEELAAAHRLCTLAYRLDRLHYQSMHDQLTGLYNRRGFDEQLHQAVSRSRRYGWAFRLVLIDLNRFKSINDRLGHPGGDAVLRAVGDRLRRELRTGDVAARIGGDEFAVLLPTNDGDDVPPVLQRLRVRVSDSEPDVELTAGIASCPVESTDADELYRLADQRLYEAKRG